MALGGEMHDDIGLKFLKGARDCGPVANVSPQEGEARIVGDRLKRRHVAGIGELIEDQNAILTVTDERARHGRTDKAGTPSDENSHTPSISNHRHGNHGPEWTDADRGSPSVALRFGANPALRTGSLRQIYTV